MKFQFKKSGAGWVAQPAGKFCVVEAGATKQEALNNLANACFKMAQSGVWRETWTKEWHATGQAAREQALRFSRKSTKLV